MHPKKITKARLVSGGTAVMEAEQLIMSSEDIAPASAGEELEMPASEMDNLLRNRDDTTPASLKESVDRDTRSSDGTAGGFSRSKGLSVFTASGLIMLTVVFPWSMPYALAQSSLLGGAMIIVLGGTIMLYMAALVGRCWVIMMETWPDQYSHQKVRRVYPAIAKEAGGRFWEIATLISVDFTNFGAGVVLLLASASMADVLLPGHFSVRVWAVFGAIILLPLICFGTMMDAWWLGVLGGPLTMSAGLTMLLAVVLSKVYPENTISHPSSQIVSYATNMTSSPWTMTPSPLSSTGSSIAFQESASTVTFSTFWVGMSTIVFALSPMSVIPTVQHDMRKPEHYPRAILPAFTLGILVCLSIGVVGVETFGQHSNPNTLSSVRCRSSPTVQVVLKVSSVLNCAFGMCITLANLLPLTQHLEEAADLPKEVGFKHILVRSSTLLFALAVGLALPEFHKYASLIGASSMALNNFIFPPLFYYWIVKKATGVTLHRAQIGFFLFVLVVGAIIGLAGTYSAIRNIVVTSTPNPCGA